MAKHKKKKLSANQVEYAKQVKRIKNFMRRAEKRGYMFEDNIIPEKPKRITKKSIQTLKELKPNVLYTKAEYISQDTGEVIAGTEGRTLERKKSARKAKITRELKKIEWDSYLPDNYTPVNTPGFEPPEPSTTSNAHETMYKNSLAEILERFDVPDELLNHRNSRLRACAEAKRDCKNFVQGLFDDVINSEGLSGLMWRLENRATDVEKISSAIQYVESNADYVRSLTAQLCQIILDRSMTFDEQTTLMDIQDYHDNWEQPE